MRIVRNSQPKGLRIFRPNYTVGHSWLLEINNKTIAKLAKLAFFSETDVITSDENGIWFLTKDYKKSWRKLYEERS